MSPTPTYYILKSFRTEAREGTLHKAIGELRHSHLGNRITTLDLDDNVSREVLFNDLIILTNEVFCWKLLPIHPSRRLNFLQRKDMMDLMDLQVGDKVLYEGHLATILSIGCHGPSNRGYYYRIKCNANYLRAFSSDEAIVEIDKLCIPYLQRSELIQQRALCRNIMTTTTTNKNNHPVFYENGSSSYMKNNIEERNGSKALMNPSPLQSYHNYSNSVHFHPLGLPKETVVNQNLYRPQAEGSQIHRTNRYNSTLMSKSEIDGQLSCISGCDRLNQRQQLQNTPNHRRALLSYETYPQPCHQHLSTPKSNLHEDPMYSTVIKQDNRKCTTRFAPNMSAPTELSYSTALNFDDDSSSTMRDFQTVHSSHSNSSFNNNDTENCKFNSDRTSVNTSYSSSEKARSLESESEKASVLNSIKTQNCEFDTINFKPNHKKLEIGSLVEVHVQAKPLYGVLKWIGRIAPSNLEYGGIELEEKFSGAGNGSINGKKIFSCPDDCGIFVSFSKILKDKRFIDSEKVLNEELSNMNIYDYDSNADESFSSGDFGHLDCPSVSGMIHPMGLKEFYSIIGRNRGIQGFNNSCYLDSTIFAMFSFTSAFDFLLNRPPNSEDIREYTELQRVLKEDIVNPLRKNFFVRADKVMKLRKFLDSLSNVQGLTSEEKDPEELLNSLLCQTLKADPFLHLSSGQTSHYYQLFVERDEFRTNYPTVQELFEQSFFTSDVKLKRVPSVLILQMPRFGRQFKVYDKIRPTQALDVTDIIECAHRQCTICGCMAALECRSCFRQHGNGLDSTAFCRNCHKRTHSHKNRDHVARNLKLPESMTTNNTCNRLFMKLFAVLCIETSHYVTFAKCGDGKLAQWCLFDSMADRKGEANGYNIPEVSRASNLGDYLRNSEKSDESENEKSLSPHVKRLLCDGYMYFYQSMIL
ncbi:ubiquitin carboxyl-terminal hydrolase CYLD [Lepeophtheirus salmonis]|uniref:ubiquitin carboxyl-terminal hydrolase CYLD n=1 Tax=Lepeophtheirus salmonis TaxID=72036 RepID=UPI001AE88AA1|nr:ubiquitin carboxyl-terminal hydrolase CYLD-like [Lepeophtheirus salmonis]